MLKVGKKLGLGQTESFMIFTDLFIIVDIYSEFCLNIFLFVGAISVAYQHYKQLDIKALQLNHLSYLLLVPLMVSGAGDAALDLADDMVRFYTSCIFETFEFQQQSISREDFFNVVELELMKKDLKYSTSYMKAAYGRLWVLPLRRHVRYVFDLLSCSPILTPMFKN